MTTTQLDWSVGIGEEEDYGEAATPTRFFESAATMKHDVQKQQSKGFRPGKRVNRLNRNVLKRVEVSGDMNLDATTKGLGYVLKAALGVVTNTLIADTSPAVYQQVHTLKKTDFVQSYTIQEVLPTIGGDGYPHTFTGNVVDSIEFSAKEGGDLEVKVAWLGRDMSTEVSPTAASYPVDDDVLSFVHCSIGYDGAFTPPTTLALAALDAASPSNNVKDFSVKVSQNLDKEGYNAGGSGRRSRPNLLGLAAVSGKVTVEYTDNLLRDAYLDQTPLPLVITFLHERVLSEEPTPIVGVLQIGIPAILLKGEVPTSNDGKAITQSIDWEAFDNGSASEPIWVVYRTLDTTP